MKNKSTDTSLGKAIYDLCSLLTMLFCVLRACDVITWKWYWVISPLIASYAIGIIALIVAGVIAISLVKNKDK